MMRVSWGSIRAPAAALLLAAVLAAIAADTLADGGLAAPYLIAGPAPAAGWPPPPPKDPVAVESLARQLTDELAAAVQEAASASGSDSLSAIIGKRSAPEGDFTGSTDISSASTTFNSRTTSDQSNPSCEPATESTVAATTTSAEVTSETGRSSTAETQSVASEGEKGSSTEGSAGGDGECSDVSNTELSAQGESSREAADSRRMRRQGSGDEETPGRRLEALLGRVADKNSPVEEAAVETNDVPEPFSVSPIAPKTTFLGDRDTLASATLNNDANISPLTSPRHKGLLKKRKKVHDFAQAQSQLATQQAQDEVQQQNQRVQQQKPTSWQEEQKQQQEQQQQTSRREQQPSTSQQQQSTRQQQPMQQQQQSTREQQPRQQQQQPTRPQETTCHSQAILQPSSLTSQKSQAPSKHFWTVNRRRQQDRAQQMLQQQTPQQQQQYEQQQQVSQNVNELPVMQRVPQEQYMAQDRLLVQQEHQQTTEDQEKQQQQQSIPTSPSLPILEARALVANEKAKNIEPMRHTGTMGGETHESPRAKTVERFQPWIIDADGDHLMLVPSDPIDRSEDASDSDTTPGSSAPAPLQDRLLKSRKMSADKQDTSIEDATSSTRIVDPSQHMAQVDLNFPFPDLPTQMHKSHANMRSDKNSHDMQSKKVVSRRPSGKKYNEAMLGEVLKKPIHGDPSDQSKKYDVRDDKLNSKSHYKNDKKNRLNDDKFREVVETILLGNKLLNDAEDLNMGEDNSGDVEMGKKSEENLKKTKNSKFSKHTDILSNVPISWPRQYGMSSLYQNSSQPFAVHSIPVTVTWKERPPESTSRTDSTSFLNGKKPEKISSSSLNPTPSSDTPAAPSSFDNLRRNTFRSKAHSELSETPQIMKSGAIDSRVRGRKSKLPNNGTLIQRTVIETAVVPDKSGQLSSGSAVLVQNILMMPESLSTQPKCCGKEGLSTGPICVTRGRLPEMLPLANPGTAPVPANESTNVIDLGAPGTLQGKPEVKSSGASGVFSPISRSTKRKEKDPKQADDEDVCDVRTEADNDIENARYIAATDTSNNLHQVSRIVGTTRDHNRAKVEVAVPEKGILYGGDSGPEVVLAETRTRPSGKDTKDVKSAADTDVNISSKDEDARNRGTLLEDELPRYKIHDHSHAAGKPPSDNLRTIPTLSSDEDDSKSVSKMADGKSRYESPKVIMRSPHDNLSNLTRSDVLSVAKPNEKRNQNAEPSKKEDSKMTENIYDLKYRNFKRQINAGDSCSLHGDEHVQRYENTTGSKTQHKKSRRKATIFKRDDSDNLNNTLSTSSGSTLATNESQSETKGFERLSNTTRNEGDPFAEKVRKWRKQATYSAGDSAAVKTVALEDAHTTPTSSSKDNIKLKRGSDRLPVTPARGVGAKRLSLLRAARPRRATAAPTMLLLPDDRLQMGVGVAQVERYKRRRKRR